MRIAPIPLLFWLLISIFRSAHAEQITEIKSKEIVDLFGGSSLVYKSTIAHGFHLRVYNYSGDGECVSSDCVKIDALLVAVSTYDEYPDRKLFRIEAPGQFKSLKAISSAKTESDSFYFEVIFNAARGDICRGYRFGLHRVQVAPKCRDWK